MATVDSITIDGFKSIAHVKHKLQPINLLIGANGSGKSNFLEALSMLRAAILEFSHFSDNVHRAGGAERLLHFGSKVTKEIRFEVSFSDQMLNFTVVMRYDIGDRLFPSVSIAESELPSKFVDYFEARPGSVPNLVFLRERTSSWRLYHFHDTGSTSPMSKAGKVNDNRFLRPDGSNLAAFLYLLNKKHAISYDLIRRTVQSVAPFLDDFMLEPLALNKESIRLEWRHRGSEAYFDASSLSDGTLRFIALATLLLQPTELRPSVILLDEPELGLHPSAITLLASLLKQASVETQIVLATQSPILLDHFQPEDVLVADRVRGATELRRLDEASLKVWLEEYSLGQLWEKNEFGGRPNRAGTDGEPAQ